MHQVTAAVQNDDPTAMKVLRFYHLGLLQMHELDGNSSALITVPESARFKYVVMPMRL